LPPPRNTESSSPKPLPSYQQIDTLLRKATVKGMGQVPVFIGSTAAATGVHSPGAGAAVQGGDVIGGAGQVAVDEASLPLKTGWIVKKAKRGKKWKLFFFVLDASTRRLQVNRACTPLLSTASAQCSCLNPNSVLVLRGRCSVQTQGLTLSYPSFHSHPQPKLSITRALQHLNPKGLSTWNRLLSTLFTFRSSGDLTAFRSSWE
jgi:hypothetical protein